MDLPGGERLHLARVMLESIEPPATEEVEQAWEQEIQRRIESVDSGEATARTWEEIKQDFKARYPLAR